MENSDGFRCVRGTILRPCKTAENVGFTLKPKVRDHRRCADGPVAAGIRRPYELHQVGVSEQARLFRAVFETHLLEWIRHWNQTRLGSAGGVPGTAAGAPRKKSRPGSQSPLGIFPAPLEQ